MADLSKVIAGLEACLKSTPKYCFGCPYEGAEYCHDEMFEDALELLRKMEQLEMDLEVTRQNLGDAREELNLWESRWANVPKKCHTCVHVATGFSGAEPCRSCYVRGNEPPTNWRYKYEA